MRVQILKDFVKQHFPSTQLLDYALDVEKITTSKARIIMLLHSSYKSFQKGKKKSIIKLPFSVLETQPHSECGWLHWCCLCGLTSNLWRIYTVSYSRHLYRRKILKLFLC